jgi:hypothetical protein
VEKVKKSSGWLSINQMAELFAVDKSCISRHLKSVFETGELERDSVVAVFATTAADGKTYQVEHYNLDAIISVGYRVNSIRGTQFRIWATQRLREYIVKGFTMDDERLKETAGGNYFDELLARIRDIRSSEKVFWRKVLDIYATSIDYDPSAEVSREFFRIIQNKMHWAAHGHPAEDVLFGPREKTTELKLRVVEFRERQVNKPDITLLAQNEPPAWECAKCGNPATQIQATGWGLDVDSLFCDACVDDEEEAYLPLVNSPRTGVCGYCG